MSSSLSRFLVAQSLLLFGGMVFAWSNLISQFTHFYTLYGTLFKVAGCTIPNPFLTPCFFGSVGFLIAVFWSVNVYQIPSRIGERRLRNFLTFCSVFAVFAVVYEMAEYYHWISSAVSISCTPGISPFVSPCFFGTLIFIVVTALAFFIVRRDIEV